MSNNESIKDTLDVIRRALEDKEDFTEKNENILILNKKVNDDGTVKLLNQSDDINEINRVIDKKLNDLMDKKLVDEIEEENDGTFINSNGTKEVPDSIKDLIKNQTNIEPEFVDIVNENFDELISDVKPKDDDIDHFWLE